MPAVTKYKHLLLSCVECHLATTRCIEGADRVTTLIGRFQSEGGVFVFEVEHSQLLRTEICVSA